MLSHCIMKKIPAISNSFSCLYSHLNFYKNSTFNSQDMQLFGQRFSCYAKSYAHQASQSQSFFDKSTCMHNIFIFFLSQGYIDDSCGRAAFSKSISNYQTNNTILFNKKKKT